MKLILRSIPPITILFIIFLARYIFPEYSQLIYFILFYVTLGLAFNIFIGLTNYVDFGYVAFLALGTYGMALTVENLSAVFLKIDDLSLRILAMLILGITLGVLLAASLASIVGSIALRLRGAYFAIATIGVNEGFRYLIEGIGMWGGSEGIIIAKELIDLYGGEGMAYISTELADILLFITSIISALVLFYMNNSKIGYALAALRGEEDVAKIFGINVTKYKVLTFIISASIAGMLGAIKVLKDQAVFPPQAFSISYTIEAITVVMIGGIGTLLGPILGGIIYALAKFYLTILFPGIQLIFLAPVLIIIAILSPAGILGVIRKTLKDTSLEKLLT